MITIAPSQRMNLADLFANHIGLRSALDAMLQGHYGEARADSAAEPKVAALAVGPFTFLGGDSAHPVADQLVGQFTDFRVISVANSDWHEKITMWQNSETSIEKRYAFSSERLDRAHLQLLAANVPDGFEIRTLDLELAERLCTEVHKNLIPALFGYELPLAKGLGLIRQSGFDATSLWWEQELTFPDGDAAGAIARVCDAGLLLENIHVPYQGCNALWSADETIREPMVIQHIAWLEDCARFKVPVMVMHISQGHEIEAVNDHGVDSVRRIASAAAELGVVAAIENTRKPHFIAHLLREIEEPHLGLCYDSGHNWLYGEPKAAVLAEWGHRLAATHLHGNDGLEDLHWLPKEGVVDWERVARAFPGSTYTGTIALEVVPRDDSVPPVAFLQQAYAQVQWLEQLFAQASE